MAHADIDTPDVDTIFVPVEGTFHPFVLWAFDGGDALVEDVTIAHDGEIVDTIQDAAVADAVLSLDGDVKVVALLWLQVGISEDHITHVTHVEAHVHLLERRGTEAAGIVGTEGEPRELIDDCQALGEGFLGRGGEVVVAHAAHHVESVGDIPVELGIAVDIVLRVGGTGYKLIGREVVVHVVGSQDQVVLAKGIAEQGVDDVLTIAVVMVVGTSAVGHIVGLVILVVGIRQFEVAITVPGISALQSGTVGIEMIVVGVALTGAEEIRASACQRQLVGGPPYESLLDIIGFLSEESADV